MSINKNFSKEFLWEQAAWKILKQMMAEPSFLIQHQIGPFNDFLDKGLKNVIEQFNPITLNYEFVTQQKFYKFKPESKFHTNDEWIEYNELSDINKTFLDKYSIINNQLQRLIYQNIFQLPQKKNSYYRLNFMSLFRNILSLKTLM